MSDQWIIKPVGGQNLEITVPDIFKIDTTENIDVTVLQRAITEYLEYEVRKQQGVLGDCYGHCENHSCGIVCIIQIPIGK